jgi:saccharopine dehydrogenase (NAD+, L-lysine-forming)
MPRYVVLGYGSMGRIIIKDLFATTGENSEIVIAGHDIKAARAMARSYKSRRVTSAFADVKSHSSMVRAFKGADVVIHAIHHEYNVAVMKACLEAGCDYTDLGGLYHWVKPQLALHKQFRKKGLTAVISMGASPGITDILAHFAADQLDTAEQVHVVVGNYDATEVIRASPLSSAYSIDTVFQEFSMKPAVLTRGRIKFVEPMSGRISYKLPEPVGIVKPMFTIHSELATIPAALRKKGIRECTFRIAFDDQFVNNVKFLRDLGLTSGAPVSVGGKKVRPRDVLISVLRRLPKPVLGKPEQYEILRSTVIGKKNGKRKKIVMDCHVPGMPEWNIGLDIDTGSPPSIVAQFLARGLISAKGVYSPGVAVPHAEFFKELARRRMSIYQNGKKLKLHKLRHIHGVH